MTRRTGGLLAALLALASGCGKKKAPGEAPVATPLLADDAGMACVSPGELAPGLEVTRVLAPEPPAIAVGDRCLTFVRIDPARFRLRLHAGAFEGGAKTAPEWAAGDPAGAINASMFHLEGTSIGLMVDGERVVTAKDNAALGGFYAFDPVREGLPAVAVFGRECEGFDLARVRADYRVVVQNYRMLDCAGKPIAWKDEKSYSAALIGVDRDGWALFIHSRTPYTMSALARMIASAAPPPGVSGALFVEGGPEASLYARAGAHEVREIGSFESLFLEADSNDRFWALPNVIAFEPRVR